MSDANSLRALRCPNCGAPLDFAPGQSTVRCRFCDSIIENSADDMTDDDHARVISGGPAAASAPGTPPGPAHRYIIKMRNGMPVVIEAEGQPGTPINTWQTSFGPSTSMSTGTVTSMPMMTTPASRRSSSGVGCLLGVVMVVVIALGAAAAVFLGSPQAGAFVQQVLSGNVNEALGTVSTIGSRIVVGRSGTIVPGTNDGPAEAVLLTTQYPASGSTNEMRLVALDTSTRKLLWQTAPLDAKLYDTPILANGDFIFILNQQQLMAIKRTDGTVGWQTTLADQVQLNLCDCVKLVGTKLVILSDDGTLEAFDTATGRSQWKAKSMSDSPRGLYVLGKRVAFMDRDPDVHGVLRAFDLATGKETSVQPECQSEDNNYTDYADWTTPLHLSPKGTEFYLLFGSPYGCAQRWDAQTLKMSWSASMPKDSPGSVDGLKPVFSADTLFLSNDSNVLAFALKSGEGRVAVADPDYNFNVLAVHGEDVILQARRQRGSTRYAIWAVNAASGETHWTFDMGENPPLDPGGIIDDSQPMWLAQPATDGLRVIRFKGAADDKSYAILIDTLNWDTGESAGQKSTPLNLDTIILSAPDWIFWKNDTMWMAMESQLLAFDVVQRKMVFQWP